MELEERKKKKIQMKEEAKCFFSSETQAQPQESDRNHTAQIVEYWQIFGVNKFIRIKLPP